MRRGLAWWSRGVRDFIHKGINASDSHHYKNGKGDNVGARMALFNYKDGGAVNEEMFSVKSKWENL